MPATLCAVTTCSEVAGNLIENCSFETGDLTDWSANNWIVGSNESGIEANSGNYFASTGCSGSGCISPDPSPSGAWLYQDLSTSVGGLYDLSFYYNPNNLGPSEIQVLWGSSSSPLSATAPGEGVCISGTNCIYDNSIYCDDCFDADWTEVTVDDIVATSDSMRLEFLGEQEYLYDGVDDVSVVQVGSTVPEPSSALMFVSAAVFLIILALVRSARSTKMARRRPFSR
jgi:hypothetical protein